MSLDEGDNFILETEIEEVISSVFPRKDTFDDVRFNEVEYINNLFVDEKSFEGIDYELGRLKYHVQSIDKEIINCISRQIRDEEVGKMQLNSSKSIIREFYNSIFEMESKAINCENLIGDICKDINTLDFAKKNLSEIMGTLDVLISIVDGMERIKTVSEKCDYFELNRLLNSINEDIDPFLSHKNDRIEEIRQAFDSTKKIIKVQLFNEFEFVDIGKYSKKKIQSLHDACSAIEAMGRATRDEFIVHFSRRQLSTYDLQFKKDAEISQLKNIEQRFKWCLKWISNYERNYEKIFPNTWRVGESVVESFCQLTRFKMVQILEKLDNKVNVKELKFALKTTIKFECALADYFNKKLLEAPKDELVGLLRPDDREDPAKAQTLSAETKTTNSETTSKFKGAISDCFENYMYLYVEYQESIMEEKFKEIADAETWIIEENSVYKVFSSARFLIEMLSKVRNNISNLNKSKAFFDIVSLFPRYLESYMNFLMEKLLQMQQTPSLTIADQIKCCIVINTSNYMHSMISLMTMIVKDEILPELRNKVDFTLQQKTSMKVLSISLEMINKSITNKLDPYFAQMKNLQWIENKNSNISDASPYMINITQYLKETVPIFKFHIFRDIFDERVAEEQYRPDYFMIICDAIVVHTIRKFELSLKSCNKISEMGAQQLLLDLAHLKNVLLILPQITWSPPNENRINPPEPDPEPIPHSYTKRVIKEMEDVQSLIKVIMTPEDMLVDTYNILITNKSEKCLLEIMQLKGINPTQQQIHLQNLDY